MSENTASIKAAIAPASASLTATLIPASKAAEETIAPEVATPRRPHPRLKRCWELRLANFRACSRNFSD